MWSNRGHLAGLVALVAVVAGGVAYAAIPGAGGLISACRDTKDGELRVVAEEAGCKKGELPLSWNQRGEPGSAGPPGPAGPSGTPGPAGPPSPLGPNRLSQISWNHGGVSVMGAPTPKLVDTAGTLIKTDPSSRLRLTWQGSVAMLRAEPYGSCHFFLKVGDRSGAVWVRTTAVPGQSEVVDPVTLVDVFDGLPAGGHPVTIWTVADAGSPECVGNAGGWLQTILVEELAG